MKPGAHLRLFCSTLKFACWSNLFWKWEKNVPVPRKNLSSQDFRGRRKRECGTTAGGRDTNFSTVRNSCFRKQEKIIAANLDMHIFVAKLAVHFYRKWKWGVELFGHAYYAGFEKFQQITGVGLRWWKVYLVTPENHIFRLSIENFRKRCILRPK